MRGAEPCVCGCGRLSKPPHRICAACRQAIKRAKDRQRAGTADLDLRLAGHRRYLKFRDGEYEGLQARAKQTCRCNGHHVLEDASSKRPYCLKCARYRVGAPS